MEIRDTRYVESPDGVYIAYQTVGEGPIDIVWQFDWVGNVDLIWEHPGIGPWLRGMASFSRVILHDPGARVFRAETSRHPTSRRASQTSALSSTPSDRRVRCSRERLRVAALTCCLPRAIQIV